MSQPDVDQELARLLDATRAGTEPDAAARARVRAALAMGLAGAGAVRGATRVGLRTKLWLLGVVVVVSAVSGVVWFLLQAPPTVHAPAPVSSVALPAPEPSMSAAAVASVAPPVIDLPNPAPSASADLAARSEPAPARSTPKVAEPADELSLVSSMQLALRSGNASQALALANEHARRFPGGALAQEREGARAIARCQLAKPEGRASILANFEQRYGGSPYAARVRDACAR